MATLALTALASSLTSGLTRLGGALVSAAAVAGAQYVGGMIDAAIFGGGSATTKREGPRLENLDVMTSAEGTGIPWVNGRALVGGTVIWATRIKETVTMDSESVESGKGGGGGSQTVETTSYSYSVSFAIALADTRGSGVRHFGRIWADNRPLDPSTVEVRFYKGTDTQDPDPLIEAVEVEAPAYRGIAYLVFADPRHRMGA